MPNDRGFVDYHPNFRLSQLQEVSLECLPKHCQPSLTCLMQGEYNESSMDQQCVEDENYVPGCKVQDRQNPDGEGRKSGLIIDPTNPDNVPIGDYLRYICPEVNSAQ